MRFLWLDLAQEIKVLLGFFTEEEIWVIFAVQQGSTEPKLREITGRSVDYMIIEPDHLGFHILDDTS